MSNATDATDPAPVLSRAEVEELERYATHESRVVDFTGDAMRSVLRSHEALCAERDRLRSLPEWIIGKLQTMKDYYEPPTDGRDARSEIQGWLHVLCFHYEQNRREVKEYDAARRRAKELEAEVAQLRAERDRLAGEVERLRAEMKAVAKILDFVAVMSQADRHMLNDVLSRLREAPA